MVLLTVLPLLASTYKTFFFFRYLLPGLAVVRFEPLNLISCFNLFYQHHYLCWPQPTRHNFFSCYLLPVLAVVGFEPPNLVSQFNGPTNSATSAGLNQQDTFLFPLFALSASSGWIWTPKLINNKVLLTDKKIAKYLTAKRLCSGSILVDPLPNNPHFEDSNYAAGIGRETMAKNVY
jgi:hypothetical protein